MSTRLTAPAPGHRWRVDTFAVPAAARDAFLRRVRETHELLEIQPGFVRAQLLERTVADGSVNVVTLVEWESSDSMVAAKAAVAALRAGTGFDPRQMFDALGIRAELGEYRSLDA